MLPNIGLPELIIVMGLAILLFGKRLPEVARSMGKGIVEFKKGLSGLGDELDISGTGSKPSTSYGSSSWRTEEHSTGGDAAYSDASVPKFELPGTASAPAPAPAETITTGTAPSVDEHSELPRD
jgi:sec-independent protein translocase protein TatA